MGTMILYAALIIAFNFIVDVMTAWLNPKARA
jgi:ABC-type dipeptide/oligopeptide/nickel transport system permease component